MNRLEENSALFLIICFIPAVAILASQSGTLQTTSFFFFNTSNRNATINETIVKSGANGRKYLVEVFGRVKKHVSR